MIDKEYRWYVLYVIRHHEEQVNNWLLNQGQEVFTPLKKSLKRWSDRIKEVYEPVFPSYVFVKLSSKEYYNVLSNRSVIRYVSFAGHAATISEARIDSLRKVFLSQVSFEVNDQDLKKGDKVLVCNGPLIGVEGEIILHQGTDKLKLELEEIGYNLVVNISGNYLIKTSSLCHIN